MDFLEDLFDFGDHKKRKHGDSHYGKHGGHDHDDHYDDHHHDNEHDNYQNQPKRQGAMCPSCSAQNMQGAKFCQGCGTALNVASHCTKCGNKVAANDSFCSECGNKLR
jgi:membrane protease subunit (stomatin/prohibitin family)